MNQNCKETYMPQFRVEKSGNKNKDDLRVMIAGVIICVMMIFGQTAYNKIHDQFFAPRPFITALVELVHVNPELPPLVRYDAEPLQDVSGTWVASVYSVGGTRLSTRRGTGNYTVLDDEPRLWAWSAWFDNEQSDPPEIPDEPFYVCVRYQVTANDSGILDGTPKYCSNVYDVDNPTFFLSDYMNKEIVQ